MSDEDKDLPYIADSLESLFDRICTYPPMSWLDRILRGPVTPPE